MPGTEVPGIVVRADWSGPGSAGRLLLLGQLLAGLLVDRLHAELDLAPVVEADDLDLDLVALLEDVGDLLHPIGLHLRNVDEAVAGAEEVHDGAEVDDLHDLAVVDLADLRLGDDDLDPVDRRLAGRVVDRRDLDRAVVPDVARKSGG